MNYFSKLLPWKLILIYFVCGVGAGAAVMAYSIPFWSLAIAFTFVYIAGYASGRQGADTLAYYREKYLRQQQED